MAIGDDGIILGMTEKLALVTDSYITPEFVTGGLDARGWKYGFAHDVRGVESYLVEHQPEALCILSMALLGCTLGEFGRLLRTGINNGVARIAVATLKHGEIQMIWNSILARSRTELMSFPQPTEGKELDEILDFVTGVGGASV